MKNKLPRICFIGCGDIAERHTKIVKKLFPKIELSFASRNKSKAQEFSQKFDGKNYFSNYTEAMTSDAFDIAFITTPHAFHSELAILAADNKKAIIIEKPVARNTDEFKKIQSAVSRNKVRCVVAENYYYKPFIKKIRKYIDKNYIGDILTIELNRTNKNSITGWRTDAKMMGGGALLEGGVHWVNALVSIAGSKPTEVIAFKPEVKYNTNIPFEDSILVNVKFSNGIIGKLTHSWSFANPFKGMNLSKIYGSDGTITFESNGLFFYIYGRKKKVSFINPSDFLGFKAMHRSFIEDYINNKPWKPSLEAIGFELNLVETAYKSLKTKKLEKIK